MIRRLTAAAALVVLCAGAAAAQLGIGGPAGRPPALPPPRDATMLLPALLQAANLTADQDARVRVLLTSRRGASQPRFQQLRQAEQQLLDQLTSTGPVTVAELQPQLDTIGALRRQLLQDMAALAVEIRSVLTPEQLALLRQPRNRT